MATETFGDQSSILAPVTTTTARQIFLDPNRGSKYHPALWAKERDLPRDYALNVKDFELDTMACLIAGSKIGV
jgi:hypothetical protein